MLFDRKNNHHFKGYTCNKLYKRSLIEAHRVRFDTRVRISEDIKFNFDYLTHIQNAYVTALCGYHYYLNESSATYHTIATLSDEKEDLITYYLDGTQDTAVRTAILQFAVIYYRGVLYECYHGRAPMSLTKHISRFFRTNRRFYLQSKVLSKKEKLFALCVGQAEPLYHLTQLRKGEEK